jgi:hypothetical protein
MRDHSSRCPSSLRQSRAYRRALALSLVGACALAAPQAQALDIFDPTGPLRVAILARIATITARIYAVCDSIARATRSIQERQELMFPRESLDKIGSVFQTVRSLGDELHDLDSQYDLGIDSNQIRMALEGHVAIVRANLSSIWGAPSGPSRDLEEYTAWAGHRRYTSVASYLAVQDQWQDAATSLAHQARASAGASAGRSIRLTAVAASMGLQQATVANKLAAERLDAAQEALDLERYDDVLADALGDVFLAGFTRAAQVHATTAIPGLPEDVVLGGWL